MISYNDAKIIFQLKRSNMNFWKTSTITKWCQDNIDNNKWGFIYTYSSVWFLFLDEEDAMLFKLIYSDFL